MSEPSDKLHKLTSEITRAKEAMHKAINDRDTLLESEDPQMMAIQRAQIKVDTCKRFYQRLMEELKAIGNKEKSK